MSLPPLSLSDVQHIAHLARLKLTADETMHIYEKLDNFVKFVAQIQAVDTHGIEPLAYPIEQGALRLRDDVLTKPLKRNAYQKCAPDVYEGLYQVPKVIE